MTCQYLNTGQLITAAKSAGWSGNDLKTIVSITMAEASLNAKGEAYTCSLNPTSGAQGILQFEPGTQADLGMPAGCAYDPFCSYKYAKILQQKQGWNAWQSYTTGAYSLWLAVVGKVMGIHGTNPDTYSIPGSTPVFGGLTGLLGQTGATIQHHNPLDIPHNTRTAASNAADATGTAIGNALGSAFSGLWSDMQSFLTRVFFVVLGLIVAIVAVHILTSGQSTNISVNAIKSNIQSAGEKKTITSDVVEGAA